MGDAPAGAARSARRRRRHQAPPATAATPATATAFVRRLGTGAHGTRGHPTGPTRPRWPAYDRSPATSQRGNDAAMDTTTAYGETRRRMTELMRSLDAAAGARPVPACPAWTVQQLASHAVGVSADILAGNTGSAGTDPWTEAQVQARSGRSLAELADEWDETGSQVEAALVGGLLPAQAVFDLVTHEHDLRGAIDRFGARDHEAVAIGLTFVEQAWPFVMRGYAIPPLRITTGGGADLVAGEDPEVTLHLTPFEALRALTGRRSTAQLAAYDWGTDPTPWFPAFTWGPFTVTPVDLD